MPPEFASDEDLLDRLSARPHELVFLVGSAVTAPARSGEPGVPRVDGVIELIRGQYRRASELQRFEAALAAEPDNRYQAAFRFLLKTRDQDVANAVIRQAVLLSRRPSERFPETPAEDHHQGLCRELEDDLEGWHLPPAAEALGRVLAATPPTARPMVLTSNFDPLVAISVRRAGGRAYTTAMHGDGSLAGVDGQGCLVVHFHGDWFRTDTLHTPSQLGQDRPKLSASLAQLISARTLVVLGYSGWDDVFTRSLIGAIRGGLAPIKVAWAFYARDDAAIARGSARLLAALHPGVELGRVVLYKGIDAHEFLPRLAARVAELAAEDAASSGASSPRAGDQAQGSGSFAAAEASGSSVRTGDQAQGSGSFAGLTDAPLGTHAIEPAAAPARNPFQKAGMLGLDVPSYVSRTADAALRTALAEHTFTVIRGDFSIGKSSLLLRSELYWGRQGAALCRLDMQMMRVDDTEIFLDEFFDEVSRACGETLRSWREVQAAAERRPLLVTLDEFAGLTPEVAQRFVPALYKVAVAAGPAMRVVLTTRAPIAEVLADLEQDNPNLGEWHEVELRAFTEAELDALLSHLPARARAAALAERAALREHSKLLPKPAQCLCYNLFKDEAAGATEVALAQRVRRKESYR